MTDPTPRQVFIQGITRDGRTFRPSDWAERLCGAMSCFRPDGVRGGIGAFFGYSPYCVRRTFNVAIPVRALFDAPTIAGLAEHVDALRWAAQGAASGAVGRTELEL